jgi:acetylglutamate kinase
VEGVSINGAIIHRLAASEAKRSLSTLGPGMITKVYAALEGLSMGVGKVMIASGRRENPITSAFHEQNGTLVIA